MRNMMGEENNGLRTELIQVMDQTLNVLDTKISTEVQSEAGCREALALKVEEACKKVHGLTERLEKVEVRETPQEGSNIVACTSAETRHVLPCNGTRP